MIDPQVSTALIAAMQAVTVAIIAGLFSRSERRRQKVADDDRREREKRRREQDERDEHRRQLDEATADLLLANAEASEVLLIHATGQHLNGNVEAARTHLASAKSGYGKLRGHIVASNI